MSWLRDYLYAPLGIRVPFGRQALNLMIVFSVSGLGHGANWTFIAWGAGNGVMYIVYMLYRRYVARSWPKNNIVKSIRSIGGVLTVVAMESVLLVFFRSADINQAIHYLGSMLTVAIFDGGGDASWVDYGQITLLLTVESLTVWRFSRWDCPLILVQHWPRVFRWGVYLLVAWLTIAGYRTDQPFIYFQF